MDGWMISPRLSAVKRHTPPTYEKENPRWI